MLKFFALLSFSVGKGKVEWTTQAHADFRGTPTRLQVKNRISNKNMPKNTSFFEKIAKVAKF